MPQLGDPTNEQDPGCGGLPSAAAVHQGAMLVLAERRGSGIMI